MTLSYNQIFLKAYSILFAQKVGEDDYGNIYFVDKSKNPTNNFRERRWIIYNGSVEASKVPQEWNAWLHHVTKSIPKKTTRKPKWFKKHLPNQTGTMNSIISKNKIIKDKINNLYSTWKPNDKK
tara:strand:+ start:162 stop:533 length:372 start_codon:yes stop_codon:yes gene_type:complete